MTNKELIEELKVTLRQPLVGFRDSLPINTVLLSEVIDTLEETEKLKMHAFACNYCGHEQIPIKALMENERLRKLL